MLGFTLGEVVLTVLAQLARDWLRLKWIITGHYTVAILYLYFVPESPYWLLSVKKHDQLETCLRKIATANGRKNEDWYPSYIQLTQKLSEVPDSIRGSANRKKSRFVRFLPRNESMLIGRFCRAMRSFLVKRLFVNCGSNINVNRLAYFGSGRNLTLGENSGIGERCQIANDTVIGRDVMMAPDVIVFSVGHETKRVDIPMINQGNLPPNPVRIEDDVWIGQRAILLPGITIGKGAIVAKNSTIETCPIILPNCDSVGSLHRRGGHFQKEKPPQTKHCRENSFS